MTLAVTTPWSARRPLTVAQQIRAHDAVVDAVRTFLQREGHPEAVWPASSPTPRGGGAIVVEQLDLTLPELCGLLERLLKQVALGLHADLIGGANATRLDRMVRLAHPRLTYREALAFLERRGLALSFGDDPDGAAEAALIRSCGNLPLQVTSFPAPLRPGDAKLDGSVAPVAERVDVLLPFAGRTCCGWLRGGSGICASGTSAGFDLAVTRLVQYLLGLESIEEVVALSAGRGAPGC